MTTRSASCGRQGFARFVSALVLCGTAVVLCPPIVGALGYSGAPSDNVTLRALCPPTVARAARTACARTIDAIGVHSTTAAAVLPQADSPRPSFVVQSLVPGREPPPSGGAVRPHDERGPPDPSAADASLLDDDDQEQDDDQVFDASTASLTATAHTPVHSSITYRALHHSAAQDSVRAPPQ